MHSAASAVALILPIFLDVSEKDFVKNRADYLWLLTEINEASLSSEQ